MPFGPKKVNKLAPNSSQVNIFPFSHWVSIDHVLQMSSTFHISFDLPFNLQHFQIRPQMMTKWEIWVQHQFLQISCDINCKMFWNVPLDTLMCPLQIINWIEPLSLTFGTVNGYFIHQPTNVENYLIKLCPMLWGDGPGTLLFLT